MHSRIYSLYLVSELYTAYLWWFLPSYYLDCLGHYTHDTSKFLHVLDPHMEPVSISEHIFSLQLQFKNWLKQNSLVFKNFQNTVFQKIYTSLDYLYS